MYCAGKEPLKVHNLYERCHANSREALRSEGQAWTYASASAFCSKKTGLFTCSKKKKKNTTPHRFQQASPAMFKWRNFNHIYWSFRIQCKTFSIKCYAGYICKSILLEQLETMYWIPTLQRAKPQQCSLQKAIHFWTCLFAQTDASSTLSPCGRNLRSRMLCQVWLVPGV